MKHGLALMLHMTMIQTALTYMQIFKACTFSANPCMWQAWHKAQAHTPSHKQEGTCAQALK
jgi:hypothetical protein